MIQRTIPNPYQSLYRSLIGGAFLLNIPAVLAMSSGNNLITMLLGLSQFVMFFLGVIFLIKGKQDVRGILRLLEGKLLAHWAYDKFHWDVYASAELKRNRENAYITLIVFLIVGPLVSLSGYRSMTMTEGMILGGTLGLFSFGIGMVYAKGVFKRSKRPPYEAFISKTSAFINGVFIDWSSSGITMIDAIVGNDRKTGFPSVIFKYTVRGKYGVQEREMLIPVPDGKIQEANTIVAELQTLVQR